VNAALDELPREIEIVLKRVLLAARIADVARITEGRLDHAARLADSVDPELHVPTH
jgi:hypothetical protein